VYAEQFSLQPNKIAPLWDCGLVRPTMSHALKPVFDRGRWITAIHSCRAQISVLGFFNYIGLIGLGLTLITLNLSHINYINT